MSRLLPIATMSLMLLAGPVYGQASRSSMDTTLAGPRSPGAWARRSRLAVPLALPTIARLPAGWTFTPAPAADRVGMPTPARRSSGFSVRSILHTVAGAVVGAGVGYFASQVVDSDWESDAPAASERMPWAIGGAVLGGIGGHLLGRGRPVDDGIGPRARMVRGYEVLTGEALVQSGAQNIYQAIRALRPRWLRGRGASSRSEMFLGVVVPVYFGRSRLGTQEQLRDIGVRTVEEIRYYDAAQASAIWGTGHPNGAIQILTPTNH